MTLPRVLAWLPALNLQAVYNQPTIKFMKENIEKKLKEGAMNDIEKIVHRLSQRYWGMDEPPNTEMDKDVDQLCCVVLSQMNRIIELESQENDERLEQCVCHETSVRNCPVHGNQEPAPSVSACCRAPTEWTTAKHDSRFCTKCGQPCEVK